MDHGFAVEATHVRRWDPSPAGIRASLESSLERLGLDHGDILYLHDPDVYDLQSGLDLGVPVLAELRAAGRVAAIGVGTNSAAAAAELAATGELDLVMIAGRYTLAEQPAAAELLPVCARTGTLVVPVGVMNSGLLARPEVPADAHYDYAQAPPAVIERARHIAQRCTAHGTDLPTAALHFPTRHPVVPGIILGASRPEQVTQNLERLAAAVPEALWDDLAAAGLIPAEPALRIDAHLHIWDPALGYTWLETAPAPLRRPHDLAEAAAAVLDDGACGILVQADDTPEDTARMLDAARPEDRFIGVVGWLPLDDPEATAAALAQWQAEPLLLGVRHLVHDDPRPDFLALPAVRDSLARVAAAGYVFEVPDAYPAHLPLVADLAGSLPELPIVIDHLGKPPAGGPRTPEWEEWAAQLAECAAHPNVHAKISGLQDALPHAQAAIGIALELFGARRLLSGSDWPMTEAGDTTQTVRTTVADAVDSLPAAARRRNRWATALELYRPVRRPSEEAA
ncbi:putative TIM-barrel fold metal-dependent hydrolase/aryl-alcohol dehydrogenase-like putative oxidoreductase [Brevibacterium pityocampae]